MSTTGAATRRPVSRSTARSRKPMSKRALWATRTASPANERKRRTARSADGAPRTSPWAIPVRAVIAVGSGTPGLTRVSNVAPASSASTRCAPISTIRERAGERPVVSRSNTTNEACSSRSAAPGGSASPTAAPRQASRASPETTSSSSARAIAVGAEASAKSDRAASPAGTGPRRASTSSTRRSAPSKESCIRRCYTNICSMPRDHKERALAGPSLAFHGGGRAAS